MPDFDVTQVVTTSVVLTFTNDERRYDVRPNRNVSTNLVLEQKQGIGSQP